MVLQSNCDTNTSTDQSITCQVVANKCRNLKYDCSNVQVVTYSCSSIDEFGDLAALVVDAEPPQVKEQINYQRKTESVETLTQSIKTQIEAACGTVSSASQTIESTLQCTNSSNVVLNVLNTMDSTAACVTLQVATMVAEARAALAGPSGAKAPLSNQLIVLIALGGAAVVGLAILLAAWKL